MKVKVSFTIDIDPEAWSEEYGIDGTADIRADVQRHAANIVSEHFETVGVRL